MQSWTEIKKIQNPTEAEQMEAVNLNWYAISLIENPTELVQKTAFAKNAQAILYIKNGLCEDVKKTLNEMDVESFQKAIDLEPNLLKFITNPTLLKAAVQVDWKIIKKIDNPSDDLLAEATRQSLEVLRFIRNPGEKILIAAVECKWSFIQEIEKPSIAVVLAAVKQDFHAFEYVSIRHRTEEMQMAVVRENPRCIQYLQRASEDVQMEAVKQSKEFFDLIKNPCPAVIEFCK